jgi:hypothetical protein
MEGFEHISLTDNELVSSYTSEQFCHHEAAQALLTNPPLEGTKRHIWSRWCQNELQFHVDAITRFRLEAQAQAASNPLLVPVECSAPPVVMDTG